MAQINQKKQLSINIIWSVSALIINTLTSFILTSYISKNLGIDAYGFIALADNFISYVDIIVISLNSLAARFITIAYHREQYEKANKYFNSVLTADLILAVVISIIFSLIIVKLEIILQIPDQLINDVKVLFALVVANYLVNMISVVFKACVYIKNRMDYVSKSDLIKLLIKATLLFILFGCLKPHVWYVTISIIPGSVLVFLFFKKATKRLTPELKINFSYASVHNIIEILCAGIWNSINSLGNMLNSGLDLLITNMWIAPIAMGQLSVSQKLSSIIMQFLSTVSNTFAPIQLKDYAEGDKEQIYQNLNFAMKTTGVFCVVFISVFFCVGIDFLKLWIPDEDVGTINLLTRIVLTGNIIVGICYPLYYVNTMTKKLKIPCIVTIISGTINVLSMALLIKYTTLGIYAVVLTTLVLNWITNFTFVPLYAAGTLKLKYIAFFPTILRYMVTILASVIGCMIVYNIFPMINSWLMLCIESAILGGISIIVTLILFLNKDERKKLILAVKTKLGK